MTLQERVKRAEVEAYVATLDKACPSCQRDNPRKGAPYCVECNRTWNRLRDEQVRGRHGYATSRGVNETSLPSSDGTADTHEPIRRHPNLGKRKRKVLGASGRGGSSWTSSDFSRASLAKGTGTRVVSGLAGDLAGRAKREASLDEHEAWMADAALATIAARLRPSARLTSSADASLVESAPRDWRGQE